MLPYSFTQSNMYLVLLYAIDWDTVVKKQIRFSIPQTLHFSVKNRYQTSMQTYFVSCQGSNSKLHTCQVSTLPLSSHPPVHQISNQINMTSIKKQKNNQDRKELEKSIHNIYCTQRRSVQEGRSRSIKIKQLYKNLEKEYSRQRMQV